MTWSKDKISDLFWPRNFLPQERDIGTARILTFGYNADVRSSGRNAVSVLDFAKDLLYDLKYSKDENTNDLNIATVCFSALMVSVAHSNRSAGSPHIRCAFNGGVDCEGST